MTQKELLEWHTLQKQVKNGYHMERWDWQELTRLNHQVMEMAHEIHNKNMID